LFFFVEAHIGIGISGGEGQQAVLASDFSKGEKTIRAFPSTPIHSNARE